MSTQKPGGTAPVFFVAGSNFNLAVRKSVKWFFKHHLHIFSMLSLALVFMLTFLSISPGSAQVGAAPIDLVWAMEPDATGLSTPAGLAFSFRANAFYVMEDHGQSAPANTDIFKLTPFDMPAGSARIAAQVKDPINTTFDNKFNRLLIFLSPQNQILEVRVSPDGNLDPRTLTRNDARGFGVQNPQGMSLDPASGTLFILDAVGPRIVRIQPSADGSIDQAVVSSVDLQSSGLTNVRGLAFDPTTGHLHLVSLAEKRLYELTQTGQVVAFRDLAEFNLSDPRGMVFAPSGDQTDNPSEMSLYLADSGAATGQSQGSKQSSGQIVELSFASIPQPGPISFTSSLIRTTDLSKISPPSPDPDGLAYIPSTNTLMMSDSEVEETVNGITHFQGANVWELSLSGSVVRSANISKVQPTVVPMSNEPTGVAWNPANGHFYISDDGKKVVLDLNPGADGLIGTKDDSWTNFGTSGVGDGDPEGITLDTMHDRIFVADGKNKEIYQYTLAGSLVNHFDVEQYGVADPETVEFDTNSGTLFVLSSKPNRPVIVETDLNGNLIQTIDISASKALKPAGLAIAPASDGSGNKRFYMVDRGIDNNTDPTIIDGKMYEMTSP